MPMVIHGNVNAQSRLRAALLRLRPACLLGATLLPLTLTGCANGGGSLITTMFEDALGVSEADPAARADEIPFATINIDTGDRRGLVVLGAQGNAETYWPTGHQGLIALRHEALHTTVGLAHNLLDTAYRLRGDAEVPWQQAEPAPFEVTRSWQDEQGLPRRMTAEGELRCDEARPFDLPLATLTLQPCTQVLNWDNGDVTEGVLWRDPQNHRLWAGEEQAWPDGPTIRWEVARPWW
ncbi:YjbF family lipoprotein [Halomonas alimentaria]|uniref:YjbF family lipoprotein n=1 Tax=Halomonas alimentaria TaxID=147248 RepID=A0A7X4W5E2_9GAMM|nr:YjbF family lipoprotein [Halomonas alimentaria]NAW34707.1 YjbF family lipoprotein [Halomonas alimentaria]